MSRSASLGTDNCANSGINPSTPRKHGIRGAVILTANSTEKIPDRKQIPVMVQQTYPGESPNPSPDKPIPSVFHGHREFYNLRRSFSQKICTRRCPVTFSGNIVGIHPKRHLMTAHHTMV